MTCPFKEGRRRPGRELFSGGDHDGMVRFHSGSEIYVPIFPHSVHRFLATI